MHRSRIALQQTRPLSSTALLNALCKRIIAHRSNSAGGPTLLRTKSELADAMCGLLHARTMFDHLKRSEKHSATLVNAAFVKLARQDVALVTDVMQRQPTIDVLQPRDGRAANLLAYSLPKAQCDEVIWEQLVRLCERGCAAGHWAPADVKGIVSQIGFWGAYSPALVAALESYVAARVRTCSESDVSTLALILSALTELHRSRLFGDITTRTVSLCAHMSTASIGRLVQALLRAQYVAPEEAFIKALQTQGIRYAEDCDLHSAVLMFCYLSAVGGSQRGGASWLDSDVLKCIVERIVSDDGSGSNAEVVGDSSSSSASASGGGGLDIQTIMLLTRSIKDFPKERRRELSVELGELLQYVSRDVAAVVEQPAAVGGISDEKNLDLVQTFLSRYLQLVTVDRRALRKQQEPSEKREAKKAEEPLGSGDDAEAETADESPPMSTPHSSSPPHGDVLTALRAVSKFVTDRVEDLVSSENPPFSLIPRLLHCPAPEARAAALVILREIALQNITLPTLQTYQFLLALGDYQLMDKRVYRHLRNQFVQTVKGIPMIQLCAALKCFVRGLDVEWVATNLKAGAVGDTHPRRAGFVPPPSLDDIESQVQRELEMEDLSTFLQQCHETISRAFSDGVEMRSVLSLTAGMYQLGYKDETFYDEVAAYLETKVAIATPSIHSARDATVTREALGGDTLPRLAQRPKLIAFFDAVVAEGAQTDHLLTPSQWMNTYDPANHITPLTEEQQRGWEILNQMHRTRSADTERLTALATEYVSLLTLHRPDDLKSFFAMFEEKVFKNDRILKDCMDHLCSLNIVTKFSGQTIASILHSLAAIRFTFHATMKRFLLAVSEEQWSQLDAAVLVQIVSGMSKLSLRIPGILIQVSERLAVVCKFLTPIDTALLINSFQSLGFHDDAVLGMLMGHAAKSAKRFDELALTLLFGSSSIHRLMTTAETSLPLLEKAERVKLPTTVKQKILNSLKRSSLPRELVQSSSARVAPELIGGGTRLQLEAPVLPAA